MSKSFMVLALMVVSLIYINYIGTDIPTDSIEPKLVPYEIHETLIDDEHHKAYSIKHKSDNLKNPILTLVNIAVHEDSENEVTIIISDQSSFKVPNNQYFPSNKVSFTPDAIKNYKVKILPSANTIFTLERILPDKSTEPIFDTTGMDFVFGRSYSKISTHLNNNFVWGFGERRKKFRYDADGQYTTYPKDQFGQVDTGKPGEQTYGYHPMWLKKEQSGNFHIGFLKSTSPLQTDFINGKSMTLHIVGGEIHLKFFLGDSNPETVTKAYHNYINGYMIQPFWSMGYHNSRWGYKSSSEMLSIRDKFDEVKFPIEVLWNDLDYMEDKKQFTLSPEYKQTEMAQLTDRTKSTGVYWVPLVDFGIAIGTEAEINGTKLGVWMKSGVYQQDLIGCVWPGSVHYPDFNHPNAMQYWNTSLHSFRDQFGLNPSGFWIDMNEVSNFIPGERSPIEECPGANPPEPAKLKPQLNDSDYLPFNVQGDVPLAIKSISLSTQHYSGSDAVIVPNQPNLQELFFHPINAYAQAMMTHEALVSLTQSKQTFSLSRSTMYGSGRYAAHWTGDNLANWDFFKYAVSELLPFQLFGIPFVGQDLCGFAGDTTAELCTRWMQLGAWSPFSRNHNDNTSIAQEPFQFPEDSYVLPTTKRAFEQRYSYLKWMYSLFVNNNNQNLGFGSGTVMRPLWWNYPTDEVAYQYEDTEFMLGQDILVAPVLEKAGENGMVSLNVYLPGTPLNDKWQEMIGQKRILDGGSSITYELSLQDDIPFFQRMGSVIPIQNSALRTRFLTDSFKLQVALKKDYATNTYSAVGQLMTVNSFDEQSVQNNCLQNQNCMVNVEVTGELINGTFEGQLKFEAINGQTVFQNNKIESLIIYGIQDKVQTYEFKSALGLVSSTVVGFTLEIQE